MSIFTKVAAGATKGLVAGSLGLAAAGTIVTKAEATDIIPTPSTFKAPDAVYFPPNNPLVNAGWAGLSNTIAAYQMEKNTVYNVNGYSFGFTYPCPCGGTGQYSGGDKITREFQSINAAGLAIKMGGAGVTAFLTTWGVNAVGFDTNPFTQKTIPGALAAVGFNILDSIGSQYVGEVLRHAIAPNTIKTTYQFDTWGQNNVPIINTGTVVTKAGMEPGKKTVLRGLGAAGGEMGLDWAFDPDGTLARPRFLAQTVDQDRAPQ